VIAAITTLITQAGNTGKRIVQNSTASPARARRMVAIGSKW
jgi:hypothetical protein